MEKATVSAEMPRVEHRGRGLGLVLLSTVLLSATGPLIKILLTEYALDRMTLALLRVLVVALGIGAVFLFRPAQFRLQGREVGALALYGVLGVGLHQIVWISSVQLNGAAIATVLVYTQAALVTLFSWRFLGEPLAPRKLAALVLALTGVVLVSRALEGGGQITALGLAMGLGTAVTWSSFAILGRVATRRTPAWTAMFYGFAFATVLLAVILAVQALLFPSAASSPLALGARWDGWAVLLFLALGPTLGGFGLYTMGLVHLPASVAVLIGTLEPVFTILLAYLLFGEVLSPAQWLGAAAILASVAILQAGGRKVA